MQPLCTRMTSQVPMFLVGNGQRFRRQVIEPLLKNKPGRYQR